MRVLILLALVGCAKTAVRDDGRSTDTRCPSFDEAARRQVDTNGAITLPELDCSPGDRCAFGVDDCLCQVSIGGAPQPARWNCHRAREKRDGCADDQTIFAGGSCATEGQRCNVPRACGCSMFSEGRCVEGHWRIEPCTVVCEAP